MAQGDPQVRQMPEAGTDPVALCQYLNVSLWQSYRDLRSPWLRQVEENVRNLAGRQYDVWVPEMNEFLNLAQVFLPGDERWRRAPVFNWLAQQWYQLSLAKLTENIPILGAMPASSDAVDALTAAIFDPFFRYQWRQMGMPEKAFDLMGWVLTAGEVWGKLRWDPSKGPPSDFYQTPEGAPRQERLGDLSCDILGPTTVLTPYGPESHYEKPWLMHEYLLDVEEAKARWPDCAADMQPDALDPRDDLLVRMNYTSFYGNSGSPGGGWGSWPTAGGIATRNLIRIRERWQRPNADDPYGRLTIVTSKCLCEDGINPYVEPGVHETAVIPFFRFRKPGFPWRQEGSSDLENLIPIARARNRTIAGLLDFVDHNEQPPLFYDQDRVPDDQVEKMNDVGARVGCTGDPRTAAAYLNTPQLPIGGKEMAQFLKQELETDGHANIGSTGAAVTETASGELQREVRFDADRVWGAFLRLSSYEWERLGQMMLDICGCCMEDTRVLAIAGEDQALNFLTVQPQLLQGRINIYTLPESAVLETRQDKQQRIGQAFTMAASLLAASPALADQYLKSIGQPDIMRALTGANAAKLLAQRQVAEMVDTGNLAPVLPEQDHATHIAVVTEFQQTMTYRDLPPEKMVLIRIYRAQHELMGAQEMVQQAQKQALVTKQVVDHVHSLTPGVSQPEPVQAKGPKKVA